MECVGTEGYEDWEFVQTLGEGAYGEVKLAISKKTKERLAVKIIDTTKEESVAANVKKECAILQLCQKSPHPNIIAFHAYKKNGPTHYIFLDFACGGELFDRIIPDEGMERILAQRYFQQLCYGVEHLHNLGVAHRDIKPENLLLDRNDNLQITDYGLATLFRHRGHKRPMERRCGTPPYAAPEVFVPEPAYEAEPADVWSCGVVLVTMLAGELPWDEPTDSQKEWLAWRRNKIYYTPWTKLSAPELTFLRRVLAPRPEKRLSLAEIYKEDWFKKEIPMPQVCERKAKRMKRSYSNEGVSVAMSQPTAARRSEPLHDSLNTTRQIFDSISFSQPLHPEYMILSQLDATQGASQATQSILQQLVRRLTRFLIKMPIGAAVAKLEAVLAQMKFNVKKVSPTQFTVSTTDGRREILSFKVQLLEMLRETVLLDFRRSKGDGLEFKKAFRNVRMEFHDVIVRSG